MPRLLSHSLLAFAVVGATSAAFAAEPAGGWSAEAAIEQYYAHDSNPARTVQGEDSIHGSVTEPSLTLTHSTPLSEVESKTRLVVGLYDESDYDAVDVYQSLKLSRRNERWTAGIEGIVERDTTRTSELTNYALNLPDVVSTRLGASPRVEFRASPYDTLILSASMLDASYDNNAYTDYTVASISPSYEHRFDAGNTGTFGLRAQRYETSDDSDLVSDSIGANIGWRGVLSPRLSASLNGGAQYNEKSGTNRGGEPTSWNYIFAGTLDYTGTQDRFSARLTRALEPFGNGTETLLTSIGFTERHAVNASLALTAEATYQHADYDSQPGINLDRGYHAGAGIEYAVTQQVALLADYDFRNEELTNITGDVDRHQVLLGFRYRHEPVRW